MFVSFGVQVDGAVIERDSGLSDLSRVGPGVRLRSGLTVLPGKNVTRSLVRNGSVVGYNSAVVGSELDVGQVIPPRTIYASDEVAGRVEW